jgi:hypothetical protein
MTRAMNFGFLSRIPIWWHYGCGVLRRRRRNLHFNAYAACRQQSYREGVRTLYRLEAPSATTPFHESKTTWVYILIHKAFHKSTRLYNHLYNAKKKWVTYRNDPPPLVRTPLILIQYTVYASFCADTFPCRRRSRPSSICSIPWVVLVGITFLTCPFSTNEGMTWCLVGDMYVRIKRSHNSSGSSSRARRRDGARGTQSTIGSGRHVPLIQGPEILAIDHESVVEEEALKFDVGWPSLLGLHSNCQKHKKLENIRGVFQE